MICLLDGFSRWLLILLDVCVWVGRIRCLVFVCLMRIRLSLLKLCVCMVSCCSGRCLLMCCVGLMICR